MNCSRWLGLVTLTLGLVAGLGVELRAGSITYDLIDLSIPGDSFSTVSSMSRSGWMLIRSAPASTPVSFYVSDGYHTTMLPSTITHVGNINNFGQVASNLSSTAIRAEGINDVGQIVGTDAASRPVLETKGVVTGLNQANGPAFFTANGLALNNAGQVAGFGVVDGSFQPLIYSDGSTTALGFSNAAAYAINDQGQVVGGSMNGPAPPFSYENGKLTFLGPVGEASGAALALNDLGLIVGRVAIGDEPEYAFLYQDGLLSNLNELIPRGTGLSLRAATGVDNQGRIAATAYDSEGRFRAVLLIPHAVPEPSPIVLAIVFVALVAGRRGLPR